MLPADSHVHSEWSWDAPLGSMERTCEKAVELGLPAIAFTEHVDHTVWMVNPDVLHPDDHLATVRSPDGELTPPRFDAAGYLEAIERCRERFPELQILSGMELGEPHWHAEEIAKLLAAGPFDRLIGSLHCLPIGDRFTEPPGQFARRPAAEVMRDYLAEIPRLIEQSEVFTVLAHIDYPIRYWPTEQAGPFDLLEFEEGFRHALRVTAESGRALEINTRLPLHSTILRWWREEGGQAVTFGSDAHMPSAVAQGFKEAAHMAEAHGFRPGKDILGIWGRAD
ncbi:PHP domain-containing protein [Streptosporangium sp. NPDC001681]|uniref:PHP domain-containing protein n=1 Tax=Streptosporangium sp. NPDC001681 TaxID=3154395 RepID=UPI00331F6BFC